jgi:hypothetical protein
MAAEASKVRKERLFSQPHAGLTLLGGIDKIDPVRLRGTFNELP